MSHRADTDALNEPPTGSCAACGYDLRAATASGSARCPECGFAIADSVRSLDRVHRRWLWKVRIGILLLLWSAPLLVVCVFMRSRWAVLGSPWTSLNFAGPKVWGTPLEWMWGTPKLELLPMLSAISINTTGVWLIASQNHESAIWPKWLRLGLRYYVVAAVAIVCVLITPWYGWPNLPEQYQLLTAVGLIELPGSVMLYGYLARIAQSLREPRLADRCGFLVCAVGVMQVLVLPVFGHVIEIRGPILESASFLYGAAGLTLGLFALDVCLDLYRALADAADETPQRNP